MRFSSGQVEASIAEDFWIKEDGRSNLHARFKKLQTFGIGNGKYVGAGRRANLTLEHALQLRFGFELTRLGMTPERVRGFMQSNWSQVAAAIPDIFDRQRNSVREAIYLIVEPSALRDLQDERATLAELVSVCVSEKLLAKRLRKSSERGAPTSLGIVNLSAMFASIILSLGVLDANLTSEIETHWRPAMPAPQYWED